jgi:hypothetical protein
LSGKTIKGISGIVVEFLDEAKPSPSDFGVKTRAKVKVTNGIEVSEKSLTFNQQNINFCVNAFGTDSKNWIGKKVGLFTETIKGNEAIRFQGAA